MTTKPLLAMFLLVLSICPCWGQSEYTIPLAKEKSSLSVPSLARNGHIMYVAYRTFNLLHSSSQLRVMAYDLESRKEIRHVTISVPKVRGQRPAQGLFISPDGKTLAYAEAYNPKLVLLLSTASLSEIRRSTVLPFTADDYYRQFAGFTNDSLLAFASAGGREAMRFLRLNSQNLSVVSDTRLSGTKWVESFAPAWLPSAELVWAVRSLNPDTDEWMQYMEKGERTGQKMHHASDVSCYGAVPIGGKGLLVFYGDMVSKGYVVSYYDHHSSDLKLACLPGPYGISDDHTYAGAICSTTTDLSEPANNKTLTSDFLLLRTNPLGILWQHKMRDIAVGNVFGPTLVIQKGTPLIFRSGKRIWIVAPSRKSELKVFMVALRE